MATEMSEDDSRARDVTETRAGCFPAVAVVVPSEQSCNEAREQFAQTRQVKEQAVREEMNLQQEAIYQIWRFLLRYFTPIGLLIVFLSAIGII